MILHRQTPVRILHVHGIMADVRYPDCRVRTVSLRRLRGSWGGDLELGWEVLRIRQAEAAGARQRRMEVAA